MHSTRVSNPRWRPPDLLWSRGRALLVANLFFLFLDSFPFPVFLGIRGFPFGSGRRKATRKNNPNEPQHGHSRWRTRCARGAEFDPRRGHVWRLLFPVSFTLFLLSNVRRVFFGSWRRDPTRKINQTSPMRKSKMAAPPSCESCSAESKRSFTPKPRLASSYPPEACV